MTQSKAKKLPKAVIAKAAREGQGHLAWIEAHADLLSAANDWIDDKLSGIDYSAVRRGGSDSSSTERAALAGHEDSVAVRAAKFKAKFDLLCTSIASVRKLAEGMRADAEKLMVDWSDEEKRKAAEFIARRANAPGASSDRCGNCGRVVAGTPNDRLRAGRCQECFRYRNRHAGIERPRELWDDGQCQATRWSAGVDFECALPMGHAQADEHDHDWRPVSQAEGTVAV